VRVMPENIPVFRTYPFKIITFAGPTLVAVRPVRFRLAISGPHGTASSGFCSTPAIVRAAQASLTRHCGALFDPARGRAQAARPPRRQPRSDPAPHDMRPVEDVRTYGPVLGEEAPVTAIFAVAHREVALHPARHRTRSFAVAREAHRVDGIEARDVALPHPLVEEPPAVARPQRLPVVEQD